MKAQYKQWQKLKPFIQMLMDAHNAAQKPILDNSLTCVPNKAVSLD